MTGIKANNEVIGLTPEAMANSRTGVPYYNGADSTCPATGNATVVTTLLELAKAAGRGTAVATIARVTRATPAATYAHICHRDGENTTANAVVPGGAGYNAALGADSIDVVLGGESQHFLPKGAAAGSVRNDPRDLTVELKAKGFNYVTDLAGLSAVPAETTQFLGLFIKGPMNFDLDRDPSRETRLT